jgi:hypothetical protein
MATIELPSYLLAIVREDDDSWAARKAQIDDRVRELTTRVQSDQERIRCVRLQACAETPAYYYWAFTPHVRDAFRRLEDDG